MKYHSRTQWSVRLCALVSVLVGASSVVANLPDPPPCTWLNWVGDDAPTLELDWYYDPAEPATIGYETKRAISLTLASGTRHRYDTCGLYQPASWPATLDSISWQVVSGAATPASGVPTEDCDQTYPGLYWISLTPQQGSSILVAAEASTDDPELPLPLQTSLTLAIDALPLRQFAHWTFDGSKTGDGGQTPYADQNVQTVSDWNGDALDIDTQNTSAAKLEYLIHEGGNNFCLTRNVGTVRFWFRPNWSGGSGPGSLGKLFEMNWLHSTPHWYLSVDASGDNLDLVSDPDVDCPAGATTHLSGDISSWVSGQWHQIVVTYSLAGTELYVDGSKLGATGSPITFMHKALTAFTLGSAVNGFEQARGSFDELETFNYPLDASRISDDYQTAVGLDTDDDGLTNIDEIAIGTDLNDPDTDGDGVLDGADPFPLDPTRWDPVPDPDPNDTTDPVIQLIQPANATLLP